MCTRGCVSMSGDCLGSVDGEQVEGGVQYEEEMHYSCRRDKHVTRVLEPASRRVSGVSERYIGLRQQNCSNRFCTADDV